MAIKDSAKLVKLSDTDEVMANPDDDIRGRAMKDSDGEDLGKVDDLLIDPNGNKVRFLVVASGGFLGIGENKSFIPVDAITGITEDDVHIDQTRERVAGGPAYDPELINKPDNDYYDDVYGYYGHTPYWTPGYTYPGYPLY